MSMLDERVTEAKGSVSANLLQSLPRWDVSAGAREPHLAALHRV